MKFRCFIFALLLAAWSAGIPSAQAHLMKLSNSELSLGGDLALWTLQVHLTDFENKFARADEATLREYLPTRLTLTQDGRPCSFESLKVDKNLPLERVTMQLKYRCPSQLGNWAVGYDLFYGDPDHRHVMKVNALGKVWSANFSPADTQFQVASDGGWQRFLNFLELGLEHILAGFDHLLFLVTLVFAAYRFRDLFGLVTAFTVGHSISLALSVTNTFSLSPSIVEPLIAASIVFVALHDLLRKPDHTPWGMILLTFGFGLIHGLGFSYALREADLRGGSLALPLFSFNLGVELGQVALICVVYPLMLGLKRLAKGAFLPFKRVALLAIAAVGLYWIVQRVFLT